MFDGARLKLERADQHVRDLDAAFTAFVNQRPHRPIMYDEHKDGKISLRIEVVVDRELPPELALIIGDAVHNFRCVLDHLVWELVQIDGRTPNRATKFPIGRTRIDFEAMARGVATAPQSTQDFLLGLGVYPSGQGEALYCIHSLDNADKHRVLTPVLHFSYLDNVLLIDLATGERTIADPVITGPVGDGSNVIFEVPDGCGIDADHHIYPTPDIFFGEIDVFPNEPVLPTLYRMCCEVEGLIRQFERFVTFRKANSILGDP
jgi:hypothetical protein